MTLLGHSIFRVSSFDAPARFKVRKVKSPQQNRSFRQSTDLLWDPSDSIGGLGRINFCKPVVPRTIEIPAFAPSEPILPRVGRGHFDSLFWPPPRSFLDSLSYLRTLF